MKGFFYKVQTAFARFMYGRNGADRLGQAALWGALILNLLSMLLGKRAPLAATVLYWVSWAGWVYVLFRLFSKNLYKRREENARFLKLWQRMKSGSAGARARHADKDHKYFTCKSCRTICRVPVGKGKIIITCPKCGAQMEART